MTSQGKRPPALSKEELKKLILGALNSSPDSNPETFHARFHHLERGLQVDDVIHGLQREWEFGAAPSFNEDHWQWHYEVATQSVDGDSITIIVAVDTFNRSFEVITRWKN